MTEFEAFLRADEELERALARIALHLALESLDDELSHTRDAAEGPETAGAPA